MKTNFKPGDIIEYCGEEYEVIENRGDRGKVKENFRYGDYLDPFYWERYGEKCVLKKEV